MTNEEVRRQTILECAAACAPYVQIGGAAGACQGSIMLKLGMVWDVEKRSYVPSPSEP